MRDLKTKVAVVTGAGSGIGRATAVALGREGARVVACDVNATLVQETVDLIRAAGNTASAEEVDVSDERAMRSMADRVAAGRGGVDIVVNNAGIAAPTTPATELSLENFRKVMEVNFWGTVYGSLFFLPHLLRRPEANLVNVASNSSIMAYSGMADYTASKFAVRGFTESLRMELAGTAVCATLVLPGATRTSLMLHSPIMREEEQRSMQRILDTSSWARSSEAVADAIRKAILANRPRMIVGLDTYALDAIVRLFPGRYSQLLAGTVRRTRSKLTQE